MPRKGRVNIEGGIYHVIQRGIERREIYRDDNDREEFLNRLKRGLNRTKHKCYGWVLMPNHFHLIIRTSVNPLSDLMRQVLTGYALYFNKRYKRTGYLFQGRYKSILCQEDRYLLELVRYIHLNPVRAKMVKGIKELNKYKWSGHRVLIGECKGEWQSTGEILMLFGKKKREAVRKYLEFIEASGMERKEELTGGGLIRSSGGWKAVKQLKKIKDKLIGDERILGDGEFVKNVLNEYKENIERKEKLKKEGWDINELVKRVCDIIKVKREEIYTRSKDNKISKARQLLVYWAKKELGLTGKEISEHLGVTNSAITQSSKLGEIIAKKNNYKLIT